LLFESYFLKVTLLTLKVSLHTTEDFTQENEQSILHCHNHPLYIIPHVGYRIWRGSTKLLTFEDCSTQITIKGNLVSNPTSPNFAFGAGSTYLTSPPPTLSKTSSIEPPTPSSPHHAYLGKDAPVLYVHSCTNTSTETDKIIERKHFHPKVDKYCR
jgi:hypothetical protein